MPGAIWAALTLAVCLAAEPVVPPDVVSITPDSRRPVEVLSQQFSADGGTLVIELQADRKDFEIELDFARTDFKRLMLVLKNTSKWEYLTYYPVTNKQRYSIDLLKLGGVRVYKSKSGSDCVIDIDAPANKVMPPGGKLLFISSFNRKL